MITYKITALPEEQRVLAPKLVEAKLHAYKGHMLDIYKYIIAGKYRRKCLIVTARMGLRYVGALIYNVNSSKLDIYVHPDYRRTLVGSSMVEALRTHDNIYNRVICVEEGDKGCDEFFKYNCLYKISGDYPPIPDDYVKEQEAKGVTGTDLYFAHMMNVCKRRKAQFMVALKQAQRDKLLCFSDGKSEMPDWMRGTAERQETTLYLIRFNRSMEYVCAIHDTGVQTTKIAKDAMYFATEDSAQHQTKSLHQKHYTGGGPLYSVVVAQMTGID